MTPEQEEQVRRALAAAARRDEPVTMPPEVADRLDAVLADLRRDDEQPGTDGSIVELARQRPPRRWPRVLVAAAAVAVLALGGTAVVRSLGSSGQDSASSASAPKADSGGGGDAASRSEAAAPSGGAGLRSGSFGADVRRLLATRKAAGVAPRDERSAGALAAGCDRPATRPGDRLLAVRLDGKPATLRVRTTADGARVAQVYSCDGAGRALHTARVTNR